MTDDLSTSLAAVLTEHREVMFIPEGCHGPTGQDGCLCGWHGEQVFRSYGAEYRAHVASVLAEFVSVLLTAAKHDAWNEAVELARTKFAAEDSVDWCRQANASSVSLPAAMEYLDDTEDDNPYSRVYTAKEPDA